MEDIQSISDQLGIRRDFVENYGKYMAKVQIGAIGEGTKKGKLILVTAMSPTRYGEGKTTTTIGLSQAFKRAGKSVSISIREPSMGPCFGVKGGATGGGRSKVEPSDRINLLFTGDFPAVSAAHNLLSAMIQNHIYHGNELNINQERIVFPRTIDMNDRSLRNIIVNAGSADNRPITKDSFVITPASEIMAILGFAMDYDDLVKRLSRILVAYTNSGKPVYSSDLKAEGAMASILVDALKPNLVQTTEGVPAFIHTGPFGNIAHGTSSIIAAKIALTHSDYVITEAGFGSDLGAEKFLNMVSREGGLRISAILVVATVRALKSLGSGNDMESIRTGFTNLLHHVSNLKNFGFDPVIALNRFSSDTEEEITEVKNLLMDNHIEFGISEVFLKGGEGAMDLVNILIDKCNNDEIEVKHTYDYEDTINTKIEKIATHIYGVKSVNFQKSALINIKHIEQLGFSHLPICMAKNQYSFSGNDLGQDDNVLNVTSISVSSGAGFLVVYCGEIMTMPGLPKIPAACDITIDSKGNIFNLF